MNATAPRKYNPGFLSDDELAESFCVRTHEFDSLVETLRDSSASASPHQIVIGPRGSGKTTLLLRVALEIRRDAELSAAFFPVVFAEESYEVATAGEFWLECLSRLAAQAPRREDDPDLRLTFEDLRTIRDDRTLGDRCLGAVLDFADRENKRLVLTVENLNMMFGDMADPDAGWRLRKVLQTEPGIVLLGSATSRFAEIDNPEHALYHQFRTLTLRPLDTDQCAVLWEAASGRSVARETVRSLEILTGGSPRLLAIMARFGAGRSFRKLMADLLDLIDDHTEYFKSHLEALPAQERRVYLALADLWKPALTKEIADRARLDTSKCSAQLARLVDRGAVQTAGGSPRRKQYYLSERLYNIYYLLRRGRGPDRLVEALIRFMEAFYSPRDLKDIGVGIVREAGEVDIEMRTLFKSAFVRLVELPALDESRHDLLAMAPAEFVPILNLGAALPDTVRPDERSGETAAQALFDKAVALDKQKQTGEALAAYDEIASLSEASASPTVLDLIVKALVNRGIVLAEMNREEEALASWDEIVRRFGESELPAHREAVAKALVNKGVALSVLNRPTEALAICDEVLRRFGDSESSSLRESVATALVNKGAVLGELNLPEEALAVCDEILRRFGDDDLLALRESVASALVNKGFALSVLNRPREALVACDEVARRFGESESSNLREQVAKALTSKVIMLGELNRPEETLTACDDVIRRFGESRIPALLEAVAMALVNKGISLSGLNRLKEALAVCDEVVRRFGESRIPAFLEAVTAALINKGIALTALNRIEEAMSAYDEAACRPGKHESPMVRVSVELAILGKAELDLRRGRPEAAIETVSRALDRDLTELPVRWQGHLIRANAALAGGGPSACERDIEAMLAILPKLDRVSKGRLDVLAAFTIGIGAKRMRELILASPAKDLLLPLTTALEWELGLKPRVAQEVEEVAGDVRRRLARLREARAGDVA